MLSALTIRQKISTYLTPSLIGLLIFLTPSSWFLKFAENSAYVRGLFVDYLILKLYASDLIIILLLAIGLSALWVRPKWLVHKHLSGVATILLGLLSLLAIRQLFAPWPATALWSWVKLIEFGGLTIFLAHYFHYLSLTQLINRPANQSTNQLIHRAWWLTLCVTVTFQSVMGFVQYYTQHSVFGYLFLGEVRLSESLNLAKTTINGQELILPYGTTSHPNVLAGVVVIFGLLALRWWRLNRKSASTLATLVMGVTMCCMIWTLLIVQSISGWLLLV